MAENQSMTGSFTLSEPAASHGSSTVRVILALVAAGVLAALLTLGGPQARGGEGISLDQFTAQAMGG